jgi:tetratricopeptide (TPR) repeat protein
MNQSTIQKNTSSLSNQNLRQKSVSSSHPSSSGLAERIKKEQSRSLSRQPSPAVNRDLFQQKSILTDELAKNRQPLRNQLSSQGTPLLNRLQQQGAPLQNRLQQQGAPLQNRLQQQGAPLREQLAKEHEQAQKRARTNPSTPLLDQLSQQKTLLYDRITNPGADPTQSGKIGSDAGDPSSGGSDNDQSGSTPTKPNRSQLYQDSFQPDNYRERYQSNNYRQTRSPFGFPNSRRDRMGYTYRNPNVVLPEQPAAEPRGLSAPTVPTEPKYSGSKNNVMMPMPRWMQNVYLTPNLSPFTGIPGEQVSSASIEIDIVPVEPGSAPPTSESSAMDQDTMNEQTPASSSDQTGQDSLASIQEEENAPPEIQTPNELLLSTGDSLFKQRQYAQAGKFYAEAVDISPTDKEIIMRLALCRFAERDYEQAGSVLREVFVDEQDQELIRRLITENYSSMVGFRYHLSRLSQYTKETRDDNAVYLYTVLSELDL